MDQQQIRLSELTENDINEMAANLIQCILYNSLDGAKVLVKDLPDDVRQELTKKHSDVDTNPALFTAVKTGNPELVRFLVVECHADLEERGIYHVEDDNSEHVVTPLWCAAVADKLDVVKVLVNLGADVNATSDTGSTPIRSSCYMTNLDVVKFLAENGGDLDKPNQNGGTCLINSVQNADLCRFLIGKGVDVNAKDGSGNIALHYAIKEGRFETVRLLIERGSNPYIKNDQGDDALRCASLKGCVSIVEYLMNKIQPGVEQQIESYQLLGANFIDEKDDVAEGLQMWQKAINIREANPFTASVNTMLKPNSAYDFATEATTQFQLKALSEDRNSVFMQALLLREKILGPAHKDTIFGLMYRGAVYADRYDYSRCVHLWKYAFRLRQGAGKHCFHEYVFTLQALCKLFLEIYIEDTTEHAKNGLTFEEVFEVLEMVTQEVKTVNKFEDVDVAEFQLEKRLNLMKLSLHLISLLCKLTSNESEAFRFRKLVYTLLSIGLRTSKGRTFLLLSVCRETKFIGDEYYGPFPNIPVVQLLLECGADVLERDNRRNTALHLLEADCFDLETVRQLADMLVAAGAHVDAVNDTGMQATHHLTSSTLKMDFSTQITLKCLSARIIRRCNLRYHDVLPRNLCGFVEMH